MKRRASITLIGGRRREKTGRALGLDVRRRCSLAPTRWSNRRTIDTSFAAYAHGSFWHQAAQNDVRSYVGFWG
jgi:hypothetical protein